MISDNKNKLLSITNFVKSVSKVLGSLKEHTVEKVGVLKTINLKQF